jgi:putative oxidoreductase
MTLFILRAAIGLTFAAHGAQKVFGWWGGPGLAGWRGAIEQMGFQPARIFAPLSALVELVGGIVLAIGLLTPFMTAVLVAQTVVIIGQVHWGNGFFNTRSGIEFPLLLGLIAVAVGLAGPGAISLDALLGLTQPAALRVGLLVAGALVGLASLQIPRRGTTAAA